MISRSVLMAAIASILGKAAYDDYKNLAQRKREMDAVNLIGGDNYYHRLGMCENAQKGLHHVATSLGGGVIKEMADIACKTTGKCGKKDTFINNLKDSGKDMKNNIGGLYWGLTHPDKDCKIWLENLDMESNTWKK